jgi:hypothetical protein
VPHTDALRPARVLVGAAATGWLALTALFTLLGLAAPPLVRGLEKAPRADGAGAGLSGPAGARPHHMCHTRTTETSRRAL